MNKTGNAWEMAPNWEEKPLDDLVYSCITSSRSGKLAAASRKCIECQPMGATGLIPTKDPNPASRMLTLAGIVVVIVGLYFGRRVLIPLALSIVLSFLATPLVTLFERLR